MSDIQPSPCIKPCTHRGAERLLAAVLLVLHEWEASVLHVRCSDGGDGRGPLAAVWAVFAAVWAVLTLV